MSAGDLNPSMVVAIVAPVIFLALYLVLSRRDELGGLPANGKAPLRSIRYKIRSVIRSTTICLLALSATGVVGTALLTDAVVEVTKVQQAERANASVLQIMTDGETSLRGYQLRKETSYLDLLRSAQERVVPRIAELSQSIGQVPEVSSDVALEAQLVQKWQAAYAAPYLAGRTSPPTDDELDAAKAAFDDIRVVNKRVADWAESRRVHLERMAVATAAVTVGSLLAAGLLGFTVGLRPARRALSGIAPPLESMNQMVRRLGEGDLAARVDDSVGVLEIRNVAGALNSYAEAQERSEQQAADELRLTALERDWGVALHSLTDLREVLDSTVAPLAHGIDATGVWIRAFDGDEDLPGRGMLAMYPKLDSWEPPTTLISAVRDVAVLCWRAQQPTVIYEDDRGPSEAIRPALREQILEFIRLVEGHSLVLASFGSGETFLGYLALARGAEGPRWTPMELQAVQRMGKDIGRAIAQTRTFSREQQLVTELQALDARKSAFVSMVSHELRTPLASVIGHLEIIRSGDLGDIDPMIDRSLDAIERNSRRLTGLIEDLLLLSRIEENTRPTTMRPIDLLSLIDETVVLIQPFAQRASVVTDVDLPVIVPDVIGDSHEIERVINNLLTNAIKFSPRGERVDLMVSSESVGEQSEVVITVRDHGIGISEADKERLFTRFFRSTNPAALSVPGTGLGLAIVKVIVERHGGRIEVDSELDVGTTMTVRLPGSDKFSSMRSRVEAFD